MAQQLENSPIDKHKAIYGEQNQANYLINAKEHFTTEFITSIDDENDKNAGVKIVKDEIKEECASPKKNIALKAK
jgi:hypothetical protein